MLGVYWTAITVVCFSVAGVSGSKIIDGFEAVPHSRPYMAQLKITKGNQLYNCGAFLIRRNVLLTAAHCHGENIMAQLGGHNRDRNEASRQEIAVKKMIPHENYDRQNAKNDIMLLQLERNVRFTPEVKPISISSNCGNLWPGMHCSVAGWGRTFTGGTGSNVLREAEVTILDICQSEQLFNLTGRVICARGSGIKGACNGDSGGPLVCRNRWNDRVAVGIVSFRNTNQCEDPAREDVYTNVCMYWRWINRKFKTIAAE
uniref:trypsin n=2 Tax=Erpetoichthys calabaricus TaxID=27687 RepID=A0A8C4T901_ERPCA